MLQLTIIGYGNQAKSWALNLKDSGFPTRIALRAGSRSIEQAKQLGLDSVIIGSDEFYQSKALALLIPDENHHEFLLQHGDKFESSTLMIYNHGYSLIKHEFQKLYPRLNHILFAVKAIGSEIRNQYLQQGKLGAVYSLEYISSGVDIKKTWLFDLAQALGINLGPFTTTFEQETQADLFSEQAMLCSLLPYATDSIFRKMLNAGIGPELAYLECWHELKLIVNAMVESGPAAFYNLISPNALVGSEKGFKKLLNKDFDQNLDQLMDDIKTKKFFTESSQTDTSLLRQEIKARWEQSPLEKTFQQLKGK